MNEKQTSTLKYGTAIATAMFIFPPIYGLYNGSRVNAGYGFLLMLERKHSIDVGLLFAQWFILGAIIALRVHLLGCPTQSRFDRIASPAPSVEHDALWLTDAKKCVFPSLLTGLIGSVAMTRQLELAPHVRLGFSLTIGICLFIATFLGMFVYRKLRSGSRKNETQASKPRAEEHSVTNAQASAPPKTTDEERP